MFDCLHLSNWRSLLPSSECFIVAFYFYLFAILITAITILINTVSNSCYCYKNFISLRAFLRLLQLVNIKYGNTEILILQEKYYLKNEILPIFKSLLHLKDFKLQICLLLHISKNNSPHYTNCY